MPCPSWIVHPACSPFRRCRTGTTACFRAPISRRYRRAGENEELFPDVILIDGVKGQLNAAMEAFAELDCTPPAVLSIAKKDEHLFSPRQDEPLKLSRHNPALRLMQSVRDEAHRFVQHYHHILRRKATLGE